MVEGTGGFVITRRYPLTAKSAWTVVAQPAARVTVKGEGGAKPFSPPSEMVWVPSATLSPKPHSSLATPSTKILAGTEGLVMTRRSAGGPIQGWPTKTS